MKLTSKDKELEKFYREGQAKKIKQSLTRQVRNKLDLLSQATCLEQLSAVPGHRLHGLKGNRKGTYALAVNGPWRITFCLHDLSATDIALEQYH